MKIVYVYVLTVALYFIHYSLSLSLSSLAPSPWMRFGRQASLHRLIINFFLIVLLASTYSPCYDSDCRSSSSSSRYVCFLLFLFLSNFDFFLYSFIGRRWWCYNNAEWTRIGNQGFAYSAQAFLFGCETKSSGSFHKDCWGLFVNGSNLFVIWSSIIRNTGRSNGSQKQIGFVDGGSSRVSRSSRFF